MQDVIRILKEIENCSSRKGKEDILIKNKENLKFKMILELVFNKYKIFGIGEKSICIFNDTENEDMFGGDIFRLIDYLLSNNTGTNKDKEIVNTFLSNIKNTYDEEMCLWYKRIILKNLRIGLTEKTVNKIHKELIPSFQVMLAKKYYEHIDKVEGKKFIVTLKLDGIRCLVKKNKDGMIQIFTKEGQPILGLKDIEEEFNKLPNDMMYDGELLAKNPEKLHSKDLYRKTVKIARAKGEKKNLIFNCFDVIPLEQFDKGESKDGCEKRKEILHQILNTSNLNNNLIKEVENLYVGNDISKIEEILEKVVSEGGEGVMVNIADKPYTCKRTDYILKVKKFKECDVRIIGFEEGKGKLVGTLGRLTIDYKGNSVGVGSGYSDKIRKEFWDNKDKYMGKIIKITYFEETKNEKGSGVSLRFPSFEEVRWDKTEPSYN